MKETKSIVVLLNKRTVTILNSMQITYSSHAWKVILLNSIKNNESEVDLMGCFDHCPNEKQREREVSALMSRLSKDKISYFVQHLATDYRNLNENEIENISPRKPIKFN